MLFIHSVLEICSVEEADGGQYTCVVANDLGSSNSSFEVDVATEGIIRLSVYLSVCVSVCVCVCLSICLRVCLCLCLSMSVCLSVGS